MPEGRAFKTVGMVTRAPTDGLESELWSLTLRQGEGEGSRTDVMTRGQWLILGLLVLLPVAVFAGVGAWSLFESGRWFWIWWTLPIGWGLASLLYRRWGQPLVIPIPELGQHAWTPRDEAALALVTAEQERLRELSTEQLTDPQFYTQLTQELSLKIARHYHPNAADPVASLSVVELLAAVHLISEDVEEWFLKVVPGGHLVTVGQWKLLAKAPAWWKTASQATWVASILSNPLNLGRYLVSQLAVEPLTGQLQQNLLGAFYTLYLRQAGFYLIELNSGRLRGGSQAYRQWMRHLTPASTADSPGSTPDPRTTDRPERASTAAPAVLPSSSTATVSGSGSSAAAPNGTSVAPIGRPVDPAAMTPGSGVEGVTVTVAVIGQVKAGKSSLVNVLLGSEAAVTDVLPATQRVQRWTYRLPETPDQLVLLDTPGYSDAGATAEQRRETETAAEHADLLLLVLEARSPAREPDVQMLGLLDEFFAQRPHLKPPPVIAVLNKIDGLSPVREWSPPYDWRRPQRPKEQSIAGAVTYAREVFGGRIVGVAPVACDRPNDRVCGHADGLVPMMAEHLGAARGAALLRGLHQHYEQNRFRQVLGQLVQAGWQLKEVLAELQRRP